MTCSRAFPFLRTLASSLLLAAAVLLWISWPGAAAPSSTADHRGVAGATDEPLDPPDGAVSVSPGRVIGEYQAGSSVGWDLSVANATGIPRALKFSITDLCTPTEGEGFARSCDDAERSAAEWVTLGRDDVVLADGDRLDVTGTIAIPAEARPGVYAVGLRTSFIEGTAEGTGLTVEAAAVSQYVLTVEGDLTEAVRVDAGARQSVVFSHEPVEFEAKISNDGDTLINTGADDGDINIDAFVSTAAQELDLPPVQLLPGGERTLTATWTETPFAGTFTPQLVLTLPSGEVLAADFPRIWVLPPWWFWLALLAALSLPVWIRLRRRRHESVRAQREHAAADDDYDEHAGER